MTVEEKAYNYASKVAKNRLTASEVAAHYGRGYIEGQEDMRHLAPFVCVSNKTWHPASELPKEGELVLVSGSFKNRIIGASGAIFSKGEFYVASTFDDPKVSRCIITGIKWWCYPPKEEEQ